MMTRILNHEKWMKLAFREAEKAIEVFKNENDSESALYLQGLCDRVAEDLAD